MINLEGVMLKPSIGLIVIKKKKVRPQTTHKSVIQRLTELITDRLTKQMIVAVRPVSRVKTRKNLQAQENKKIQKKTVIQTIQDFKPYSVKINFCKEKEQKTQNNQQKKVLKRYSQTNNHKEKEEINKRKLTQKQIIVKQNNLDETLKGWEVSEEQNLSALLKN